MVEITPEIRAQLDEAKKNCPFCKIIAGEIPASDVYSDDEIHAILDLNPWVKGHVLLMPKEHYPIIPYLPAKTFKYMFGKMPKFVKALKDSMVATGANIVIANGGVAGQQSPHFLIHVLPRDEGDRIDKYRFDQRKELDSAKSEQANKMMAQNIPIMMRNHFSRNPAPWRKQDFKGTVPGAIYEDEKVICTVADNPQCIGHLKVVPKGFNNFEDIDEETSAHLFFTASFCATAVFEGLGAQGSNIIMKTGYCTDNQGELSVHILPRYQEDGLDLVGTPMENKPDNKQIAEKIKDQTYIVGYEDESEREVVEISHEPEKISDNPKKADSEKSAPKIEPKNAKEEIEAAIDAAISK